MHAYRTERRSATEVLQATTRLLQLNGTLETALQSFGDVEHARIQSTLELYTTMMDACACAGHPAGPCRCSINSVSWEQPCARI